MKSLISLIALTTFVVGLSTYFVAGASDAPASSHAETTSSAPETQNDTTNLATVESMVGGLEDRLRTNPEDGKGWLLLAKSYHHMGRTDDARVAYKKAEALGSGDATVARQLYGLEDTEASQ